MPSQSHFPDPELRQDLVNEEWVIIAPGRGRRPRNFTAKAKPRIPPPPSRDPFADPQASGHPEPVFVWPARSRWRVQVLENKFPALKHDKIMSILYDSGPYRILPAVGFHELIITRDPVKNIPDLDLADILAVLKAVQNRFQVYKANKYVECGYFFQNWGESAGASIFHPHFQLIGLPVIPGNINRSLAGSARYYKKYRRFAYDDIIDWELKHKSRIIFANRDALAFTRFASEEPFDIRVFPKSHEPFFEITAVKILKAVAAALKVSLAKIKNKLGDPDYNFFLHTAPLKNQSEYNHYHWHLDIVPKISVSAGLEIGAGVEITAIDPDDAAAFLKS